MIRLDLGSRCRISLCKVGFSIIIRAGNHADGWPSLQFKEINFYPFAWLYAKTLRWTDLSEIDEDYCNDWEIEEEEDPERYGEDWQSETAYEGQEYEEI